MANLSQDLIEASKAGKVKLAQSLLEQGAEVNYDHGSPLFWACTNNHIDVARLLLDRGADIHAAGDYTLQAVIRFGGSIELIRLLLDRGADVNRFVLCSASLRGRTDAARLLLERGADANGHDGKALELAVQFQYHKIVDLLIEHGADVRKNDDFLLSLSVAYKNWKIADRLAQRIFHPDDWRDKSREEIAAAVDQLIGKIDGKYRKPAQKLIRKHADAVLACRAAEAERIERINQALIKAMIESDLSGAQKALDAGADVHFEAGRALHSAIHAWCGGANNQKVISFLLQHIFSLDKTLAAVEAETAHLLLVIRCFPMEIPCEDKLIELIVSHGNEALKARHEECAKLDPFYWTQQELEAAAKRTPEQSLSQINKIHLAAEIAQREGSRDGEQTQKAPDPEALFSPLPVLEPQRPGVAAPTTLWHPPYGAGRGGV